MAVAKSEAREEGDQQTESIRALEAPNRTPPPVRRASAIVASMLIGEAYLAFGAKTS
jgi:hypothetical protein